MRLHTDDGTTARPTASLLGMSEEVRTNFLRNNDLPWTTWELGLDPEAVLGFGYSMYMMRYVFMILVLFRLCCLTAMRMHGRRSLFLLRSALQSRTINGPHNMGIMRL